MKVERQSAASIGGTMSRTQLIWTSIHASMKQHLLAYWTLSLGVFTVFAVGLNRPDFSQAVQATGGYQFYVDSRVPIQYDLNNKAVRHKLSLQSLPDSTLFLSFLRHKQDEASCLNLNQVSTPTVLGVDLKEMESFGLIQEPHTSHLTPHIYIDEEALVWSLMKSVGDTLVYQNDKGESVPVVIAGTYPTGIFHGNAIMSSEDFRRLWPKEVGVEVLLMKSPCPEEAAETLAMAMSEYGLNIQTVEERIRMFFEVTETYLIIFLTLGGLGLLLGIFSLMIIVRKNLAAQATTIQQYRAMGFSEPLIGQLLFRENLLVPLYAVGVGAIGSVISISANVGGAGFTTLLLAFAVLIIICLLLYYGIKYMIQQSMINITNSFIKTKSV
jgi:putative ABC transport system permease protein